MTPLNTNPQETPPKRLDEVSDLIMSLVIALMQIDAIKSDPAETNKVLAICEIITGLPVQWFTPFERQVVYGVIESLYGSPTDFMVKVIDGDISFVNKCADDCRNRSASDLCAATIEKHQKKFGALC